MKVIKVVASALVVGCFGLCGVIPCRAAETNAAIPSILQAGFTFFKQQHPEKGLDAWKQGGLVGAEFPTVANASYFTQAERTLGKYVSYELITVKMVGASSRVIYLSINYARGAVYARFLMYHGESGWVVQSMDFNTRPEALMPWLTYEGGQ